MWAMSALASRLATVITTIGTIIANHILIRQTGTATITSSPGTKAIGSGTIGNMLIGIATESGCVAEPFGPASHGSAGRV